MIISVTKKHIEMGIRENGGWCPIARAVREKFNWHYVAYIGAEFFCNGVVIRDIPKIIHEWVWRYDEGEPVQPFQFDLDLEKKRIKMVRRKK